MDYVIQIMYPPQRRPSMLEADAVKLEAANAELRCVEKCRTKALSSGQVLLYERRQRAECRRRPESRCTRRACRTLSTLGRLPWKTDHPNVEDSEAFAERRRSRPARLSVGTLFKFQLPILEGVHLTRSVHARTLCPY